VGINQVSRNRSRLAHRKVVIDHRWHRSLRIQFGELFGFMVTRLQVRNLDLIKRNCFIIDFSIILHHRLARRTSKSTPKLERVSMALRHGGEAVKINATRLLSFHFYGFVSLRGK